MEKQTVTITPEFWAALVAWQGTGSRHVRVDLDTLTADRTCKIWVYDYVLAAGAYVEGIEDLPDMVALLRKQQADIETQRELVIKQLHALEVAA